MYPALFNGRYIALESPTTTYTNRIPARKEQKKVHGTLIMSQESNQKDHFQLETPKRQLYQNPNT